MIQTCPNNCKFCSSNSSREAKTIISFEQFEKTIKYFVGNGGVQELSISGGEPFLHPDLMKMVEFCKSKGIRTVVFTSGIKKSNILTEETKEYWIEERERSLSEIEENEPWNEKAKKGVQKFYERVINPEAYTSISRKEFEQLKELGLDKIVFDWQAAEEETYNNLMGTRNMMTKVMDSMIRARVAGLDVDVHFIPMRKNYRQFPDILECLEIAEVKKISLLNFVPQGRGKSNSEELMLSDDEMQEFANIYNRAKKNFNGKIRVGIPLIGGIKHLCNAGTEKLDIKYDGTVLPCPAFKETSAEVLEKHGITLYNIYDDLQKIKLRSGKREEPLCKQIYEFNPNFNSKGESR